MNHQAVPWWKSAVFYHIYPRSFYDTNKDGIGDIPGIIEKLPYLRELGIDAIWMGPFFCSPQVDNGYDISDYYAIDPQFGTLSDVENLIWKAHESGIRVLLDLVFNHTSDRHEWFVKSCRKEPDYKDYYIWQDAAPDGSPPNSWQSIFEGNAWTFNEERGQYYLHLFAPDQPDLNWKTPQVREEMARIANFWIGKGVDGFRMDVINLISKRFNPDPVYFDGPEALAYIREFRHSLNRKDEILLVGEMPCVSPRAALEYLLPENKAMDMILVFDHVSVDNGPGGKWDIKPWKPSDLMEILNRWQNITRNPRWASLYMSNHDQPRILSRMGSEKFRYHSATSLAVLFYLQRGTPIIYQGDEIGMINPGIESFDDLQDIESINAYHKMREDWELSEFETLERIRKIARDNGRTPMQWSSDNQGGFTEGDPWFPVTEDYRKWNVQKQADDEFSVLNFYKKLIRLCKTPLMSLGDFSLLINEDLTVYKRTLENQTAYIFVNLNPFPVELTLTEVPFSRIDEQNITILLSNYRRNTFAIAKESRMIFNPYECLVIR